MIDKIISLLDDGEKEGLRLQVQVLRNRVAKMEREHADMQRRVVAAVGWTTE